MRKEKERGSENVKIGRENFSFFVLGSKTGN
jgi:hypothetical protein